MDEKEYLSLRGDLRGSFAKELEDRYAATLNGDESPQEAFKKLATLCLYEIATVKADMIISLQVIRNDTCLTTSHRKDQSFGSNPPPNVDGYSN